MKFSNALTRWIDGRVAALAATLFTIGFWLEMASFPHFFFFNPLQTADPVLRVEHIFFTIGWVLFATVPMICVWLASRFQKVTKALYLLSVTLWPVSIFFIQITLAVKGMGFYAYLANYPISALFDLLVPAYFLAVYGNVFGAREKC